MKTGREGNEETGKKRIVETGIMKPEGSGRKREDGRKETGTTGKQKRIGMKKMEATGRKNSPTSSGEQKPRGFKILGKPCMPWGHTQEIMSR